MDYTNLSPFLTPSAIERFRRNVLVAESGCWTWRGRISQGGYGRMRANYVEAAAHRVSYAIRHGSIPEGLVIDHLCRNRACVNTDHLEAVTQSTNVRRGDLCRNRLTVGSRCPAGHKLTQKTLMNPLGTPRCRICYNEYMREYMRSYRVPEKTH